MSREILFRGQRFDNGEWVESNCIMQISGQNPRLWANFDGWVEVISATVGQFTGLTDKNGTKIFEGDILYIKSAHGVDCVVGKGIIYYNEALFQHRVREIKPCAEDSEIGLIYRNCDLTHIDRFEVIGNIFDNPELMEKTK